MFDLNVNIDSKVYNYYLLKKYLSSINSGDKFFIVLFIIGCGQRGAILRV